MATYRYTDGLVALDGSATALQLQGQFAQAQTVQSQALTGLRKVLGMDSVYTLSAESHLASLLQRQGKLSEAAAHFRKTLVALRRIEVPEKIATLNCILAFSRLLREQGELPEALALAREAAEGARRVLDKRDHRVGVFLTEYGKALVASGLL